MLVVEDAFEVLRSSGLGPDARAAFAAILDHVIDDFDREGRQVGNRAKYRALLDLLPMGIPGQPGRRVWRRCCPILPG